MKCSDRSHLGESKNRADSRGGYPVVSDRGESRRFGLIVGVGEASTGAGGRSRAGAVSRTARLRFTLPADPALNQPDCDVADVQ